MAVSARWLLLFAFSTLVACSTKRSQEDGLEASQPNLVILFMDDGGYGDLGCFGHPTIRTPNLDRMAREGMRFTQFYSASPACSASRYGLMTGRLPIRSGFPWVLWPNHDRGLHPQEFSLAEAMRDGGYATACFGKWHLGDRPEFLPTSHGFDQYFGLPYSNDMRPPKWPPLPLMQNEAVLEENPQQSELTRRYTEHALAFIESHKERPFFVYLPYAMPHVPLHASERFAGQSSRGPYGDVIEEIDWSVGQVLQKLRELELERETLVFFTSDNGPWIIKKARGGSAGLLRDGKGSTWEGGIRVPAIAWWPGTVPAASVEARVSSTMDLYATGAAMAGTELPQDRSIDGASLLTVLRGAPPLTDPKPLFCYGPGNRLHAVRKGDWKLHVRTSSQTKREYFDGKLPLLFHLARDPSEQYDLADDFPEVVADLEAELERHRAQVESEPPYWSAES